ncbi:MAG: cellulose binding domain-containing protein [Lachnospiraceae bacterium]|nr:cellulose binding domain-containing protein [Lachnospiraceae bacterium]
MKKGFILGFAVALLAVIVLGGVFLLGRKTAKISDNNNATTTAQNNKSEETTSQSAEGKTETEETNATDTDDVKPADNKDLRIAAGESWEEGDVKCYKYEIFIKNTTDKDKKDWKVEIDVPDKTKLGDFWNGDLKLDDKVITAKPMEYNKEIKVDAEVSFGFILRTEDKYEIDESKVRLSY